MKAFYTVNVTGVVPEQEQSRVTNTTRPNVTTNDGASSLVLISTLPTETVNVENQEVSNDGRSTKENEAKKIAIVMMMIASIGENHNERNK